MADPEHQIPDAAAPLDDRLAYLLKGTVDQVTEADLAAKLKQADEEGRPLTVKVGFDPTAPDIHLGHTVLMRKMKHFQDLGHRVIFLIGDFTGMIGDPTGKNKTRPTLTREAIEQNAETYKAQAFKILHPERTVIDFNARWLGALSSREFIRLAATYNVARMLERDDFKKRFQGGTAISVHEFLYPLMQAYDSVFLHADVELGGTDQLFNLLVGRDVMREYALPPQVVLTTPLLEGLDGVEKMSKSLNNYVGIDEPPEEVFGKVMSISDDLMWRYYELCTDCMPAEVAALRRAVAAGETHPKQAKTDLARRIIADFHDAAAADRAAAAFERVFARKQTPDDMPEHRLTVAPEPIWWPKLLVDAGMARSSSEARRLLTQGGVSLDGEPVTDPAATLDCSRPGSRVLKVGKRRFTRIIIEA